MLLLHEVVDMRMATQSKGMGHDRIITVNVSEEKLIWTVVNYVVNIMSNF